MTTSRDMSEITTNRHGHPASATSSLPSFGDDHQLSSTHDEPLSFEEFLQYPEDSFQSTDFTTLPHWHEQQQTVQHFPFRAVEMESSATGAISHNMNAPASTGEVSVRKHDNSPILRDHPVLSCTVDTSHYQVVGDDQWRWSSVDNTDATSPSSVDSDPVRPYTPTTPVGGDSFLRTMYGNSSISNTFVPKVDSASFGGSTSSSFGSVSSDFLVPSLSTGSSFGSVFHPGSFPQHQGAPLSSSLPPSVAYQGHFSSHSHGLPGGGLTAGQSVPPQQIFAPPPTALPDLERDPLDISPDNSDQDTDSESDTGDQTLAKVQQRRAQDKKLLKMREKGFSYKEIKRRCNFTEAESTLRGRVRVLTKHKSERVRNPQWTEDDIELLERAVAHFEGSEGRYGRGRDVHGRVPWKKISDWMKTHGSSYRFAAATCARKWKELN